MLKPYLKECNQTYSEVSLMISTENQKKLHKLYQALRDDNLEMQLINDLLEKEFKDIESEYNIDIKNTAEDELRKILKMT